MKIIFKDHQGNQVCSAELSIKDTDMLIIEPIQSSQPRNPMEAVQQMFEQTNSIYPKMRLYTISETNVEIEK